MWRWLSTFFGWTSRGKGVRDAARGLKAVCARNFHAWNRDNHRATDGTSTTQIGYQLAEWIQIAEIDCSKAVLPWLRVKARLAGPLKAIAFECRVHAADFSAAQAEHSTLGLRQPNPTIPFAIYVLILSALAVAEYAFNAVGMAGLRLPRWETYALAAVPSIIAPPLAHFLGVSLRHGKKSSAATWRTVLVGLLSFACLAAFVVAIGAIRSDYLQEVGKVAAARKAIALALVNAACLLGAVAIAFAAHDADSDVERVVKTKRRLIRQLRKSRGTWNKLAAKYGAARAEAMERVRIIRYDCLGKMDEYLHAVCLVSGGADAPAWFKNATDLSLFELRDHEIFGEELEPAPRAPDEISVTLPAAPHLLDETDSTSNGNGRVLWDAPHVVPTIATHINNGS